MNALKREMESLRFQLHQRGGSEIRGGLAPPPSPEQRGGPSHHSRDGLQAGMSGNIASGFGGGRPLINGHNSESSHSGTSVNYSPAGGNSNSQIHGHGLVRQESHQHSPLSQHQIPYHQNQHHESPHSHMTPLPPHGASDPKNYRRH